MSTKLTTLTDTSSCAGREPDAAVRAQTDPAPTMADSRMLQLFQACRRLQERLTDTLVARLKDSGYTGVTAGHLTFLAELECGENHAAELARRTGISRQAVHKQVKELTALGLLAERPDARRRNQRTIVFTDAGVQLIADARSILAEMDAALPAESDGAAADNVLAFLNAVLQRLESGER